MSVKFGNTPVCHVVCVILILLAQSSVQQSCDNHMVCQGERPLLANGCCPVQAGQICQPANGTSCDAELSLSCLNDEGHVVVNGTGVCTGRFNLRVTSFGEKNVSLAWSAFAPPGYMYEYVLLTREGSFHSDIQQWRIKEIGNQPSYTVRRLNPATVYLLKVAVWEDAHAQVLGNISETVVIETRAVQFCEHRGQVYLVGQQFVHDCEDNCTCLPTGQFNCTPLCPETGVPEVQDGCHIASGDTCCEYRIVCPVGGEPCEVDGNTYSHGEQFEIGCRFCTCNQGTTECTYPEECHVSEPTDLCPSPVRREVVGQCCPEWYCGETCHYDNQTYSHLEYFTSDNCSLCQCDTTDNIQCADQECPPVEMVLPDAACPDPHIRQDGCCDTLHCHDLSLDTAEYIRRIFAISYSPASLTLSFEVDSQSEHNGIPLYCQYEIQYANTSDPFVTWHRRLVQPIDVRLNNDQPDNLAPTAALTRDNTIVVGDRVYVTLSGMHPNTTYYVRIIPLDVIWDDMAMPTSGNFNYSESTMSAMVVVKTMSLENVTSCFYNGKAILHGEAVRDQCSHTCTCIMGKVVCQSSCEADRVVMATSPTCPRPRLVKQEGQCCPAWTCSPSSTGCRHGGLIMDSGQSVTEECQLCTCSNGTVSCRSVCPPTSLPPRPGCKLVNISGHCCSQWQCQLESHLPYGVKSSVLIHFNGRCLGSFPNCLDEMKQKLLSYVTSQMGCSSNASYITKFCNSVQVQIMFLGACDDINKYRKRRSLQSNNAHEKIPVVISLHMNFSSTVPDFVIVQRVKSAGLQLMSLLNVSFSIELDNGQVMPSLEGAKFEGESFICDHGFSFVKESCVLSEIESSLSFKPNLQLTPVQVTSSSARLEWSPLGDELKGLITGIQVEHRQVGTVQWLINNVLDSRVASFTLTSLTSDTEFSAQLIALTAWSGKARWKIAETHFRTTPASAPTPLTFSLTMVTVAETSAVFYWNHLPVQSQPTAVDILYKQSHHELYKTVKQGMTVNTTQVELQNLDPHTTYTAQLVVQLSSDAEVKFYPVHFVTLESRSTSAELLIGVVTSCVLTAVTSVILTLFCIIWWQRRKKGKNNGFENKIFGIQLENNNVEINTGPVPNPAGN